MSTAPKGGQVCILNVARIVLPEVYASVRSNSFLQRMVCVGIDVVVGGGRRELMHTWMNMRFDLTAIAPNSLFTLAVTVQMEICKC